MALNKNVTINQDGDVVVTKTPEPIVSVTPLSNIKYMLDNRKKLIAKKKANGAPSETLARIQAGIDDLQDTVDKAAVAGAKTDFERGQADQAAKANV